MNGKVQKTNQLLTAHLNRSSYRILEQEAGISKKAACTAVNKATNTLIDSNDLTRILHVQKYSGILLIDGKYVPVKEVDGKARPGLIPRSAKRRHTTRKGLVTIAAIDYETHDIPAYCVTLSENSYDIRQLFEELKSLSYPLKVIVCDESMGRIAEMAKEVFPDVIIQICCTHYSAAIERTLAGKSARRTYRAMQKKLDALSEDICIPTRHAARTKALELTNAMADLEYEYGYLWDMHDLFQELLWNIQTEDELQAWEDDLNRCIGRMCLTTYPYRKRIEDRYRDYYAKRAWITAAIRHPELAIPRTTNLIEGWNSTMLELRFASIRGFEKEHYARQYINALILKYRFHQFTDCKGKFKHLNGKTPLELVEPQLPFRFNFKTDDWMVLCQKLKKSS